MIQQRCKRPGHLAFFFLIAASFFACDYQNEQQGLSEVHIQGATMGTTYSVKALVNFEMLKESDASLSADIDSLLENYNAVMSTYIADSGISKLNAGVVNEWLEVDPSLARLIVESQALYTLSQGAFDITVGPVVNLWGFGPEKITSPPNPDQLRDTMTRVGMEYVEVDGNRVRKLRDVYIDLSAIAKGDATDAISDFLEARGVVNYMAEIGGEVKIRGLNGRGRAWTIGIEKPALGRQGAVMGVSGDGVAIATSGEYRNFYEVDGQRVSHTIDPSTGKPIRHNLASVTVVADRCARADGLATALNVMGYERAKALSEKEGIAAFFIIKQETGFRTDRSTAFEQYEVSL